MPILIKFISSFSCLMIFKGASMSSDPIDYFLRNLNSEYSVVDSIQSHPTIINCKIDSFPLSVTLYGFNCYISTGSRPSDEYKINIHLPGQKPRTRCNLNYDSDFVVLFGYVKDYDVFVLWDAYKHHNFTYKSNIQVKFKTILDSSITPVSYQDRDTKEGFERIICCKSYNLMDGLIKRYQIYREDLCRSPTNNRIVSRNESYAQLRYEIKCALDDNPKLSARDLSSMFKIPIATANYHINVLRHNEDIESTLSSSDLESLREEIYEIFITTPTITLGELSELLDLSVDFFTSYYVELFVNNSPARSLLSGDSL